MPALFVMPKPFALSAAGASSPAAKLTFTATGTSTPQNTYQDIALTTPHANPVIADSAGFFAPIYLDPTLPSYRVKLSTSANVQIWQIDDVPSNQNTSQQFRLKAIAPSLTFEETDASANNKIWRLKVNNEQFLLTILNDAEGVETTVFTFDRTGTTVDQMNFAGQYLQVQGKTVATQEGATLTVTLSGFTTVVSGNAQWRRSGTKVSLLITSTLTGTSNTTDMKLTGLPSTIVMASTRAKVFCFVRDNGVDVAGAATIQLSTDSTSINFTTGAAGGAFTGSGTKGLLAGTLIVWDADGTSIA
jgi:hypothetical protein